MSTKTNLSLKGDESKYNTALPPRERILAAARDLFYHRGIHAVGVDAIAEAADTNKMTLYRHFPSKDELVAAYLRQLAEESDSVWQDFMQRHAGDPRAQLQAWLELVESFAGRSTPRGCAFMNAAAEFPDMDHPARRVIEEHKTKKRKKLVQLYGDAGLKDPDILADKIFLLLEGACVTMQSVGSPGPGVMLVDMIRTFIKEHEQL